MFQIGYLREKRVGGYLNKNFLKPTAGFNKYRWKLNPRTKSTFIAQISGKRGSLAEKMVKFIEQSPKKYPYCNKYRAILGPNSNSYIQWIINKFPKSGFKLGWRAFGKNYKIKK